MKEVHVFEDFESDFYDQILELEIQYFIRAESDFKEFSQLIKYINNDVCVAKSILKIWLI